MAIPSAASWLANTVPSLTNNVPLNLAGYSLTDNLNRTGAFVAKAFQGGETAEVIGTLKRHFASVKTVKPKASRTDSAELFVLASGFRA